MLSDIEFVLKVCSVKAKRDGVLDALRRRHAADGTEAAVLAYVKSLRPEDHDGRRVFIPELYSNSEILRYG